MGMLGQGDRYKHKKTENKTITKPKQLITEAGTAKQMGYSKGVNYLNAFIRLLKSNDKIISNIDIPLQCNLYIKQQGAGNGKTFWVNSNVRIKRF
jgi:hypothetical protein